MSRCFPFPPPGYERKENTEHVDLIPKVTHLEKKIKKEKKDKEKREGKDKKKKDQSKDKHKDKKERKEKHKDKKNEKERDKARSSRIAETDEQNHIHHDDKLVDCQNNHFKLTELVNRIRDDEKVAASKMAQSFNGSVKRSNPGSIATITIVESAAGNKFLHCSSDYAHKGIDEMARRTKFSCSKKKVEGFGSSKLLQSKNESSSVYEYAQKHNISGQTSTNGMVLSMEKSMGIDQKMEKSNSSIADGSKNIKTNRISSDYNFKVQKTINGMYKPTENFPNMVHQDVKPTEILPNMVRQDANIVRHAAKMANGEAIKHSNAVVVDRRLDGGIPSKLGNGTEKWIQGNNDRGVDYSKQEGKKNKGHKRRKKKDKNKHKDKGGEKAKKSEKNDRRHKKHYSTDDAKGNWIDSTSAKLSNLETENGKSNSVEENIKKRKEFEANGFSHEKYEWPNKLPRTISFPHIVENGRRLQLENNALPCSTKAEALSSITEVKILVDKKGHMKNDITQIVDSKQSGVLGTKADKGTSRPTHPDTKYLSEIWKVPDMDEWPVCDEQEWLFNNHQYRPGLLGPNTKGKFGETSEVWSEALRVESNDVVILPYVVPF